MDIIPKKPIFLGFSILLTVVLAVFLAFIFSSPSHTEPHKIPTADLPQIDQEEPKEISLLAVGDIMLSRNVGTRIDRARDPLLPFDTLLDLIHGADIAFGNLECPLSDSNIPIREGLVFRCLTKHFDGVLQAGFNVLSTANNHSMDQRVLGLEFTVEYLKSVGIAPVGTGNTSAEAHAGAIIETKETSIGFLAYSYAAFNDGGRSNHPQIATMHDLNRLDIDIANLKSRGADMVFVSMHAGLEYVRHPNKQQVDFAYRAIDSGADAVIGHHPHWIQTIEIYKNKPIFYSLGNFVFDQMWSQDTREGLAVKFQITNNKLQAAELIPIIIEGYCCPRLATEEEKKAILKKINLEKEILQFNPE